MSSRGLVVLLLVGLLPACGGSLDGDDDDLGGEGEGENLCADVLCPPRTECEDGACVAADPCAGVSCDQGFVCSAGSCVNPTIDEDGDGYTAGTDCDDHDPAVLPGSVAPCSSECGQGTTTCENGAWLACTAPDECECAPGETRPEACGQCGSASRACGEDGDWEPQIGACQDEGACSPAAQEVEACGGACEERTRLCGDDCQWSDWGPCSGANECAPGAVEQRACGNCGTQSRTCTAQCLFGAFGACAGEGVCAPGEQDTVACGAGGCGLQTRTCSAACGWNPFGQCSGACDQVCGDVTDDGDINYEDYEFCLGYFPFGELQEDTPCCTQYAIDTDLDGVPEESDCEAIGSWWLIGNARPPWQCGG